MTTALKVFNEKSIRTRWEDDRWFFSVIDIVAVLTDQPDQLRARKYWNKLSERLRAEGSEAVTRCHRFKLTAEDGKLRETDRADRNTFKLK